ASDRQIILATTPAVGGLARSASACIRRAADYGWGFLELPGDALDPGDALTAEGIATTVATLTAHRPQLVCGRDGQVSLADERQRNRGGCLYGCPARRRRAGTRRLERHWCQRPYVQPTPGAGVRSHGTQSRCCGIPYRAFQS